MSNRLSQVVLLLASFSTLSACADLKKTDPWEGYNRFMYKVDDNIDKYALKPAADAYVKVVPKQIRDGLYNGYTNLQYGDVILNDFLQGNLAQGSSDLGRMAVNSTLGIGGVFDIASSLNLPSHQNDFGLTLGRWGCPPGPYIVLPLLGPYTLRDVPDLGTSYLTNPLSWIDVPTAAAIPVASVQVVVMRANYNKEVAFRDEAAIDPYVFTRDAYMQYRENLIHPNKPIPPSEDIFNEDLEATTSPTTAPATATAPATRPAPTQNRNIPKIH
ncbi:MAG: MlaA family lipoprotein [Phycisphaerae bacterium]